MRVASFFAGIGGFDLGFERAGMRIVFQCEIDPFAQRVLKKHWPGAPLHDDITTLDAAVIPAADLWCAGWPCQDLSHANTERKGLGGERSGLFHTFLGLAVQAKPTWLILENVSGLLSAENGIALETVINALEDAGYLGGWFACNASDAGLPHNRDRIFFVASLGDGRAYQVFADCGELSGDFTPRGKGGPGVGPEIQDGVDGDAPLVVQRRGGFGYTLAKSICPTIRAQTGGHQGGHSDRPILCGQKLDVGRMRETDGVSPRLDGRRGRLIGNAVVPTIVEWIGRRIVAIEERFNSADARIPAIK
jgi:DNA (cytosine-5)-methyltransferase 1